MEIDIKQLIKKVMEKWYIVVITVILSVSAALIITSFITPKYSSTVTLYVINKPKDAEYTQSSLIAANESLAKNYMELISSNYVLDDVIVKLQSEYNINYTYKQLLKMMTMSQKSGTGAFHIKITNVNKAKALIIINTISEEAVVKINELEDRGECVKIIKTGQEATIPDSPNLRINVIFATLGGICLSLGIVFITIYTNNKIKTDSDLKNRYDYPVIGQIPKWNSD